MMAAAAALEIFCGSDGESSLDWYRPPGPPRNGFFPCWRQVSSGIIRSRNLSFGKPDPLLNRRTSRHRKRSALPPGHPI